MIGAFLALIGNYLKGINYIEDKHTGEVSIKIILQEGGIRNVESSRTDKN